MNSHQKTKEFIKVSLLYLCYRKKVKNYDILAFANLSILFPILI